MQMDRREVLRAPAAFAAGITLAACGGGNAATDAKAPTVLIHGGWYGAWEWTAVAQSLAALGVPAFAMDLPGAGLRATLPQSFVSGDQAALATEVSPSAGITMDAWVSDVTAFVQSVFTAFGRKVTLVTHSAAGVIANAIGEQRPDLLNSLCYVTSAMSGSNVSLGEYTTHPSFATSELGNAVVANPAVVNAYRFNPRSADAAYRAAVKSAIAGDLTDVQFAAMLSMMNPDLTLQPLGAKLPLSAGKWGSLPRVFVRATLDRDFPVALQDEWIAAADALTPSNKTRVVSLAASHSVPISKPKEVADAIASL
jgi:pimeloyl-ACP methyl ester carboxylesterase